MLETCPRSLPSTGCPLRRQPWRSSPTRDSSGCSASGTSRPASRVTPPSRSTSWPRGTGWTGACPRPGACPSAKGETPMIPRRLLDYFNGIREGRFDVESVSHVVTGRNRRNELPAEHAGRCGLHPPQPPRAPACPADGPAVLCGRARRGGRGTREAGPRDEGAIDRGGPDPAHPRRRNRGRDGPDRRGSARAGRRRDRIGRSGLPDARRHIRPRLVGDASTASPCRSGLPTWPSAPWPCRPGRTRSSSPIGRRGSCMGLGLSVVGAILASVSWFLPGTPVVRRRTIQSCRGPLASGPGYSPPWA